MFYYAKNNCIQLDDTNMDYISFGKGNKNLIMIPGLGDGLRTVKGSAIPLAHQFRYFAKDYKVYVFSRKNNLPVGYSTRDMANDLAEVMKKLSINNASVLGISQGGMIAQYMAIDHPELIDKLVLTVTSARRNKNMENVVNRWILLAKNKNYPVLFKDVIQNSYSERTLKRYKLLTPILSHVGKPKDYERFLINANACLNHNAYDLLDCIRCKTLIIGGGSDKIVGGNSSKEIASRISNSNLVMYDNLGHMAYEEANDYSDIVLEFLDS